MCRPNSGKKREMVDRVTGIKIRCNYKINMLKLCVILYFKGVFKLIITIFFYKIYSEFPTNFYLVEVGTVSGQLQRCHLCCRQDNTLLF